MSKTTNGDDNKLDNMRLCAGLRNDERKINADKLSRCGIVVETVSRAKHQVGDLISNFPLHS